MLLPDWIFQPDTAIEPSLPIIVLRLLLAWLAGCGVAYIAKRHQRSVDETLAVTLVLMCVLIAMVTQIIGENVARAFSLVGALSIVRFRTAMKTTQDVAFVLAAVVIGMAIGAGEYGVALVGFIVVGTATHFRPQWSAVHPDDAPANPGEMRLSMQVALGAINHWTAVLTEICESYEITSAATVRKGTSVAMDFQLCLRDGVSVSDAVTQLAQLDQVESVQLKRRR